MKKHQGSCVCGHSVLVRCVSRSYTPSGPPSSPLGLHSPKGPRSAGPLPIGVSARATRARDARPSKSLASRAGASHGEDHAKNDTPENGTESAPEGPPLLPTGVSALLGRRRNANYACATRADLREPSRGRRGLSRRGSCKERYSRKWDWVGPRAPAAAPNRSCSARAVHQRACRAAYVRGYTLQDSKT